SFVTLTDAGRVWRVRLGRESSPAGDYAILTAGTLDGVFGQQAVLKRILFVATPIIVLVTAGVLVGGLLGAPAGDGHGGAGGGDDDRRRRPAARGSGVRRRAGAARARLQSSAQSARDGPADAASVHGRCLARDPYPSLGHSDRRRGDARTRGASRLGIPRSP